MPRGTSAFPKDFGRTGRTWVLGWFPKWGVDCPFTRFTRSEVAGALPETWRVPGRGHARQGDSKQQVSQDDDRTDQWANQPQIWFVMVKDTQGRFPGNPLWGDGWGWALFKAEDTAASATKDYSKECIPCPSRQRTTTGYTSKTTRRCAKYRHVRPLPNRRVNPSPYEIADRNAQGLGLGRPW